jgi:hypothetical protein
MIQDYDVMAADRKAIERWEGEGGRALGPVPRIPTYRNEAYSNILHETSDDDRTYLHDPNQSIGRRAKQADRFAQSTTGGRV